MTVLLGYHLPNENNTTAASDASPPEPLSAILIDFILQHVAMYDHNIVPISILDSSAFITISLLGLISEWVIEMPRAVTGVLSFSSSVSVGVLVRLKQAVKNSSQMVNAVPALSGLLLGLCSEYMNYSDDSASWLSSTQ